MKIQFQINGRWVDGMAPIPIKERRRSDRRKSERRAGERRSHSIAMT